MARQQRERVHHVAGRGMTSIAEMDSEDMNMNADHGHDRRTTMDMTESGQPQTAEMDVNMNMT